MVDEKKTDKAAVRKPAAKARTSHDDELDQLRSAVVALAQGNQARAQEIMDARL